MTTVTQTVRELYPKVKTRGFWNGRDGHTGISIEFFAIAPKSLLSGIANYNKLKNVFKFTPTEIKNADAFDAWLNKKLKEQNAN